LRRAIPEVWAGFSSLHEQALTDGEIRPDSKKRRRWRTHKCDLGPWSGTDVGANVNRDEGRPIMDATDKVRVREPHLMDRALDRCPSCGSMRFVPVNEGGAVHFLCDDCARCWHVGLGFVARVNPYSCERCEHYARCAPVFAVDHEAPPQPARA
jgi:hypothetical protein